MNFIEKISSVTKHALASLAIHAVNAPNLLRSNAISWMRSIQSKPKSSIRPFNITFSLPVDSRSLICKSHESILLCALLLLSLFTHFQRKFCVVFNIWKRQEIKWKRKSHFERITNLQWNSIPWTNSFMLRIFRIKGKLKTFTSCSIFFCNFFPFSASFSSSCWINHFWHFNSSSQHGYGALFVHSVIWIIILLSA